MMPIDGSASLKLRRSYLRRRRTGRFADRGFVAAWIAVGAILLWMSVVGFVGIDR